MNGRCLLHGYVSQECCAGFEPEPKPKIPFLGAALRAAAQERELHRQEALALWERRQSGELTEAQYNRQLLDIGKEPDDLTREDAR